MNEFKTYHPIINFIFFASVLIYSMFLMHPICLLISLASAFTYSIILCGKKALKLNFLFLLPLFIFTAIMNPFFNHEGVTIIAYFPSGKPLTFESIMYGVSAATMLITVICWFSCLNEIVTSDKIIYLFGKILPSISIVLTMTLRFVPRFNTKFKEISLAQKGIGKHTGKKNLTEKIKQGITVFSITVSYALENSIETADSMKARGFSGSKRSYFSIFRFDSRDMKTIIYIIILNAYIIAGIIIGKFRFLYYPMITYEKINIYASTVFIAYFLLCVTPIIIEYKEAKKWKSLIQKI